MRVVPQPETVAALGRRARHVAATAAAQARTTTPRELGWRALDALDRRRPAGPPPGGGPTVRGADGAPATAVAEYWTGHTVRADAFPSAAASERYLEWRFLEYPLFREFSGLWGDHAGQVVLDYGCGPGNDVTGLALHSGARRVIGMDVSRTALELTRRRLALHGIGDERVELVHTAEDDPRVPLEDASVDHLNCQGVLHHTSDPAAVLRELGRVLKPGGTASIMVYNRRSVWFHLYVAYEKQLVEGRWPDEPAEEAFRRTTDGEDCPISRCYRSEEWVALCADAGLEGRYVGGYAGRHELRVLRRSYAAALADGRLGAEHEAFLRALVPDPGGRPMFEGFHAGLGGTFRLRRTG